MCVEASSFTVMSLFFFSVFVVFVVAPGALTQAIRNFAKSLEGWLNNAMNAIPQRMIQTKVHFTLTCVCSLMYTNNFPK